MNLKRKVIFVTVISIVLLQISCGKKDSEDSQDLKPIEMSQSVVDQPNENDTTNQESEDSDNHVSTQQSSEEREQPAEESAVPDTEEDTESFGITVDYASALMYYNPDSYLECILDNSAYATQIGFEVNEPISDVSILCLSLNDDSASDELLFDAEAVYTIPELTPDMPLVVSASFGDTIPTIGISFQASSGDRRIYGITMSGEDQSILLSEIQLVQ